MRKHCAVFERVLIRGIPKDWSLLKTTYGDSSAALAFRRSDGPVITVFISSDNSLVDNKPKTGFFDRVCSAFTWFFSNKVRFWKSF